VTLNGAAESAAAKALAGRIAMNTDGVESVDNRLVVDASTATSKSGLAHMNMDANSGHDMSEAISDA